MQRILFLASQSPRRASLVKLLGVGPIGIYPAYIDESMDSTISPSENVERLALHKARIIADEVASMDGVVLGADTTVTIGSEILEKPIDATDAERMLLRLSGHTHTVYTGVALIDTQTKKEMSFVEVTEVTFRQLSTDEIHAYIATGSPMDKAGAYGIQEDFGAVFVSRIEGDYYNVVGLPLCRLYVALKKFAPDIFFRPLINEDWEVDGDE